MSAGGAGAWDVVELARHPDRPYARDLIERLASDFVELHGDRLMADDPALVAGLGTWQCMTTLFLGQQKGRHLQDRVRRNFGMMHPEGFRKATRLARQASRFGFPIVSLVDTPGAYPGPAAEERGIASAIGTSIAEWFHTATPVVAVIIGEGSSGGALGIAVADRVLMLENAIFSVASPEAAASIVWREPGSKRDAAEQLRLTGPALLELGLVDELVPEPAGGAHRDHDAAARLVSDALRRAVLPLLDLRASELLRRRYRRFRRIDPLGRMAR